MCGFLVAFGNKEEIKENLNSFKNSTILLRHRGPDYEKFVNFDNFLLYHSRLSIVDLSDRSNQPFVSTDGRLSLLYNGEIYNYIELKEKLKNKYNFKTSSDTEVILASYLEWGSDCLNKLDGMFSFVICDHLQNSIFFARDPFGQKPLYYFQDKSIFFISSEIKPILNLKKNNSLDLISIKDYLLTNYYSHKHTTFFSSVRQLPSGSYGTFRESNLNIYKYYSNEKLESGKYKKFKKNDLISILTKNIDEHLIGDVDIGLALSSGLDSIALLALIQKSKKAKKLTKCFTLDFGKDFSEYPEVINILSKINESTLRVEYTVNEMIDDFEKLLSFNEAPIGGVMQLGISKLCKTAKEMNIKVLFNGSGLDEVLLGYESSKFLLKEKKKNFKKKLKLIDNSEIEVSKNINKSFLIDKSDFVNDIITDLTFVSKLPKNLHMIDRASMAHSVEMRNPFVSKLLVNYFTNLSKENYYDQTITKKPLRLAMAEVNKKINWFKKKINVHTPQNKWMLSKKGRVFFGDIVNSRNKFDQDIFIKKNVLNYWDNFSKRKYKTGFPIWQYVNVYFLYKLVKNLKD